MEDIMKDQIAIDGMEEIRYDSDEPEDGNRSAFERLLTVQDITSLLGLKKSYVYYLTHRKLVPHLKICGQIRFRLSDVNEWLRSKEVQVVSKEEAI
jgi:excisionase family DNA binding protein